MEFDSRRRPQPTINLSALIDIAFILVIFIVLAANFHRIRGIDLNLPNADQTQGADEDAVVISVPQREPISINGRTVSDDSVQAALKTLRKTKSSVVLYADEEVALARAVRVLDDARAAGFESVSIASEPRNK